MKSVSPFPPSGELLRVPSKLADSLIIEGLTPAQTRLAVVLVALAAVDGSWTIAKPWLERMTGIVMDNASKLLQPLEGAILFQPATSKLPARGVRLFEDLDYRPGHRRKTAGLITARLTDAARLMLHGSAPVIISADEFRRYATIGGIILRLRLGARLGKLKGPQIDSWRLRPEDLETEFGEIAQRWQISRKSVSGDDQQYLSLSRASHLFFEPGCDEIDEVSETVSVQLRALTLGEGPRSRWKAIIIESRPLRVLHPATDPAPTAEKKPAAMSDLNNMRQERLPAYARKKVKS